jgi:predicted nucleic acid-binding protein
VIPREVVVDASVAVKWLLADVRGEADVPAANQVLLRVREGEVRLFQPAHFVLEIAAVLARESPRRAARDLAELQLVEMSVVDEPEVVHLALQLAVRHGQHVFDTLYHAVALSRPEALLVTADERYWRAARHDGRVVRLSDFATLH